MKKTILLLALVLQSCSDPEITVDIETTLFNGTVDTIKGVRAKSLKLIWLDDGCVESNRRSIACGVYKYRIINQRQCND